jgi:allantoinase
LNAASRPAECEANAVRKIVRLVARTGCRTHILHVSSGLSVDVLRRAKAEGLPVSAETCPHYLTLDCDHIPDNATASASKSTHHNGSPKWETCS